MSDTNDFTFGDEDQLLSKIVSVPVGLDVQQGESSAASFDP